MILSFCQHHRGEILKHVGEKCFFTMRVCRKFCAQVDLCKLKKIFIEKLVIPLQEMISFGAGDGQKEWPDL